MRYVRIIEVRDLNPLGAANTMKKRPMTPLDFAQGVIESLEGHYAQCRTSGRAPMGSATPKPPIRR